MALIDPIITKSGRGWQKGHVFPKRGKGGQKRFGWLHSWTQQTVSSCRQDVYCLITYCSLASGVSKRRKGGGGGKGSGNYGVAEGRWGEMDTDLQIACPVVREETMAGSYISPTSIQWLRQQELGSMKSNCPLSRSRGGTLSWSELVFVSNLCLDLISQQNVSTMMWGNTFIRRF